MVNLNYKIAKSMTEVLSLLNNLRRWSYMQDQVKFNELNKQALNCLVAFFLGCYAEEAGEKVEWKDFPKVAIWRSYQKVFVNFDTQETIYEEMRKLGGLPDNVFSEATKEKIAMVTTEEWANFLGECLESKENERYQAATKIATYIELVEHSYIIDPEKYTQKEEEILKDIAKYENIPGVEKLHSKSALFKLIKTIATLRNHNRWCERAYSTHCSVLGHLFDTACMAYLMSLELGNDEALAAKHFFMGIFHDVAETWTGDTPSSIKDMIKGFRKVTEQYEDFQLEKNFYTQLPNFIIPKVKAVMFENPENKEHFKLIKGADYHASDLECNKMYNSGTKDPYFLGALKRRIFGIKQEKVELTPIGFRMYKYFCSEADARVFSPLRFVELQKTCIDIFNEYAFSETKENLELSCKKLQIILNSINDPDDYLDAKEVAINFLGSEDVLEKVMSI